MKKILRYALRIIALLLVLVVACLAIIKIVYGFGKSYPDIGSENKEGLRKLEKIIQLNYPPGNLAVGQNGHVYFNYHPLTRPGRFSDTTVFEWADGKMYPFPSLEMQKEFQGTFGMTIDKQNRI